MSLSDSGFELFQLLTQRPFVVLDTEYTADPDGDGDRLISAAVVRVVRGKRVRDGELYREMNPGVPVSAASTRVHGFTSEAVAGKRPFRHHAPPILDALRVPGGCSSSTPAATCGCCAASWNVSTRPAPPATHASPWAWPICRTSP